ncbi:MAG: nicotinate-nucleotide adenylyltransferase [Pseudomonadota bacterium]
MRWGLMGGTFNPVHFGHLRAAEEMRENMQLDRITFIPSAAPPHKTLDSSPTSLDRLKMLRLAIAGGPFAEVSDIELKRVGYSYTIDTLRQLINSTQDTEMFFIIGLDAFLEIDTWKSFKEVFRLTSFIVLTRPGVSSNMSSPDRAGGCVHAQADELGQFLTNRVSPHYQYDNNKGCYLHPDLNCVFFRSVTPFDISSSRIRSLVRQGKSIRYLVPEAVESYIMVNKFYRGKNETNVQHEEKE